MYFAPLLPGFCYHIFNRGIDRETIYREDADYHFFLNKYKKYCAEVFNTLAYNLLGNHFHFVLQVKPRATELSGQEKLLDPSQQLGHLFNSYAQFFNAKYTRTGGLFESPFHRKRIFNDAYLSSAIFYTHNNAVRHGLVKTISDWPYSSYHELLSDKDTFLSRQMLFDWFGGRQQFISFHLRPTGIIDSFWSEV